MISIRQLARRLKLSSCTVSAALRGLPWVKPSTRDRVLRCAEQSGYRTLPSLGSCLGKIALLRIKTNRGRVGLERHRAIVRAARLTALRLGYAIRELAISADEIESLSAELAAAQCVALLILPGMDVDTLRQVCKNSVPCVYADLPSDDLVVDSVCPDYHQGILLAMVRLRAAGFERPGLMLDSDLALPTREQLIAAYCRGFAADDGTSPPVFLGPAGYIDSFRSWTQRYAFDTILTTDATHARRLADCRLPVYGIHAEPQIAERGLNLNFLTVGQLAVEVLHGRIKRPRNMVMASRLSITPCWFPASPPVQSFRKSTPLPLDSWSAILGQPKPHISAGGTHATLPYKS